MNTGEPLKNPFTGNVLPSIGIKAQTPIVVPTSNTLPANQVKTNPVSQVKSQMTIPTPVATNKPIVGYSASGSPIYGGPGTLSGGTVANNYGQSTNASSPINTPIVIPTQTIQDKPQETSQNQSSYNQNNPGLYGQLITALANQSNQSNQPTTGIVQNLQGGDYSQRIQDAIAAQNRSVNINQDLNQAINDQTKAAIPIEFQQGRQAALQRDYGVQAQAATQTAQNATQIAGLTQSGLTSAGGLANSQQGLLQQALQQAASGATPQFPSYTSAQYNPTSNSYSTVGGGQYGSGPEAVANINSIQDAQKQIGLIDQNSQAIDNQFSAITNYAQQAGLTGNSPILEGFKNKFGSNFSTNPAVIGFNQAINSLNQTLQQLGESAIDINTATQTTIQQAQQTVKSDLARKRASYEEYNNKFNDNSAQENSGNSFQEGQISSDGSLIYKGGKWVKA